MSVQMILKHSRATGVDLRNSALASSEMSGRGARPARALCRSRLNTRCFIEGCAPPGHAPRGPLRLLERGHGVTGEDRRAC